MLELVSTALRQDTFPGLTSQKDLAHARQLFEERRSSPPAPPLTPRLRDCREYRKRILGTTGERLKAATEPLNRDGQCWVVEVDGLLRNGFAACLSLEGTPLFGWIIPEG